MSYPLATNAEFVNWTQPDFATSPVGEGLLWQNGQAPFVYGGVENLIPSTELPTPAVDNRGITHYFRHEFTVTQRFTNLAFELWADDGGALYLDGMEITRATTGCCVVENNVFVPPGTRPPYRSRATVTNGPPESSPEGESYTEMPDSLAGVELQAGQHLLAVEIHQASGNSDDFGFDLRFFENGTRCDFDADGRCGPLDIDLLTMHIVDGTNIATFDMTGDGTVDMDDLERFRADAATHNGFTEPYLAGDSNLDGSVNATDLNELSGNWQKMSNRWSEGDFTASGFVDAGDLNKIGMNWLTAIPSAASPESVPEPATFTLLLLGIMATRLLRRRASFYGKSAVANVR
jgi:hypothetical protein